MALIDVFGFRSTQAQTANVPNVQMSPMPSRGGIIKSTTNSIDNTDKLVTTVEGNKGEVITSLRIGVAGNVVVQTPAGNVIPYLSVLAGQTLYGKFAVVLSTAEVNGVTITTTADNICWYGGEL